MFHHSGLLILFALAVITGCSGDDSSNPSTAEQSLVVYVSADDYLARQVIAAFEKQSGVDVKAVTDTESTKTTGLANRLRAESDRPQADVFWSSESFMMIQLAKEGLLAPHESSVTNDWPTHLRDAERLWHGFGLRARVIVYSPERVAEADRPATWLDLGKSRYRDRIVMADPRFGTTRGHLGAMLAFWNIEFGEHAYIAFLENLASNNIRILTSGNAGVVEAVVNGEADLGMTDTDDVWAAQRQGADVKMIYPAHGLADEPGAGTLLIPNTVARIKGGPNPEAAATFIDFMLSEELERMLVESDSHNIPVREAIAQEYPQYAAPNALEIELSAAAHHMDRAVELAMQILE